MSVEDINYDTLGSVFERALGGVIETAGEVVRSRLRPTTSTDAEQAVSVPAGSRTRAPAEGDGPVTTFADTVRDNAGLIFGGLVALVVVGLILKKLA